MRGGLMSKLKKPQILILKIPCPSLRKAQDLKLYLKEKLEGEEYKIEIREVEDDK